MTEHTARAHATFAPSAAHRWLRCPGSVRLAEGLDEAPSVFAAEGTAAHMVAEQCLQRGINAVLYQGSKVNGFTVDAEMVDAVQTYLDVVREIELTADEFEYEQRLDMTSVVGGVFGTGDFIAYRGRKPWPGEYDGPPFTRSRVTIVDLKYGRGVAVEVKDNEQLLTYAMGVGLRYHNRGVDEVELVVVQPRAPHPDGPVRRWVTSVVDLYEHAIALQDATAAASKGDAPLVPGSHCQFCKAIGICPALRDRVTDITGLDTDALGNTIMDDPKKYSPTELALKLADAALVRVWLSGVEQFGHSEAVHGRCPPGWKLVAKRATRKWIDQDAACKVLEKYIDNEDLFDWSMRSPAQLEKELPKGVRGIIKDLAKAESTGTALAPLDDRRPAVDPNDASGFEAQEVE